MGADVLTRRRFIGTVSAVTAASVAMGASCTSKAPAKRPNIVYVFADQMRAQSTGYAGNTQVMTPHLDALAAESINFTNAVSTTPVCSPYRASLLTGQYPLTHGVFLNDIHLRDDVTSIAEVYKEHGYKTAYIGKWHLNNNGRSKYIPPEHRQGFDFWRVLECTHDYNNSKYFGDDADMQTWDGYDAIAQTDEACNYIKNNAYGDTPFILFLSWGPPHNPYLTAPESYRNMYNSADIRLRPNVPEDKAETARKEIAGYYAHITALDDCIGRVDDTLHEAGIADDTILAFTSDHGDMLHSQGQQRKQRPWDESVRVPFLLRYPAELGAEVAALDMPLGTPDIMPTLLGLSGVDIPNTVEGQDFSSVLRGEAPADNEAALIMCPATFGEWARQDDAREWRGIRTRRYTYVRGIEKPWLLFDNERDPYQLENHIEDDNYADIRAFLDDTLSTMLAENGDEFLPGSRYVEQWGYEVDETGTVPYWKKNG